MIEDGVSLTQIISCLGADPLRIYYLAESMNRPFNLSAKEKELVENALKECSEKYSAQSKYMSCLSEETEEDSTLKNYAYI